MVEKVEDEEALYRIGTVSQLTGLPASTIRTWERRYGAISPQRSKGGGRLYSDRDVERLLLLKRLTDHGDAISAIASLGMQALITRLDRRGVATPTKPALRIGLLHGSLGPALKSHRSALGDWDVRVGASELDGFVNALDSAGDLHALLLDVALLGPEPEAGFERCMEAAATDVALVVYHFASRKVLDALVAAGARVVRAPVDLDLLQRLVHDQVVAPPRSKPLMPDDSSPVSAPRYTDHQLHALRAARPSVECECPHHLAELMEMLVGFERYSSICAARSSKDRALHKTLERGTAQARLHIERLLDVVIDHEGIVV